MPAYTQPRKPPEQSQTREPAKSGGTLVHENTYASGDNSKPYRDPMQHLIEEQQKK